MHELEASLSVPQSNQKTLKRFCYTGPLQAAEAPQFFADQITLSQPGGQIMPTTVLL